MIEIKRHKLWIPQKLTGLRLPNNSQGNWCIRLKNGEKHEATLLPSTRVLSQMIILHFRLANSKMRRYQILLPRMIGKAQFHDLLVYLKIH